MNGRRRQWKAVKDLQAPDRSLLKKDVKDTLETAKNCSLEICYRDIYTINGDRPRLKNWVDMVRSMIG
jgi:hypothetical protein